MRERARDKGRLEDIVEYANNVSQLIEGYSYEDLITDKRTYYAVMKNIEIVGEAAYMLTKAFKETHPETPWKIVQGMRHVLVHDYANIVSETLYDTAINSVPALCLQVEKYLAETDWEKWELVEDSFINVSETHSDYEIVKVVRSMKLKGYPLDEIAEITGLAVDFIKAL